MPRSTRNLLAPALLIAAVLLSAALAGGEPGLPRSDHEAGWIALFDGSSLFGWSPRGEARWGAAAGVIAPEPGSGRGVLSTTTEFADFELTLEFQPDAEVNSGVFVRCAPTGEVTQQNAYEVNIFDRHERWPTGSINDVARTRVRRATVGRWNTYRILALRQRLQVTLNGEMTVNAFDRRRQRGTISLQYNGAGRIRFRNIRLRPLGLESIFNGRDLSGWRAIPGRASVFSVTPDGALNVKNGNGDLQSSRLYGDFVLQLQIISNGTHLNSGIFFRAEPGQFWSGYESQIRNQWSGDDRTKPVDYGTGGIYNRQPARRVVSSDREWFTKTVVAHGPHMAVWINGYQVSDFTDTRPPNASARQGYRSAPGVISIQGHDPTTDLSFRRIQAAELPPRQ